VQNTHISSFPPAGTLEAFLVAARRGSFSAAAEELGLTHGAVSRRIQALEAWLGTPLFDRHGRGVRPTATGSQFVRRVERSMGAIVDMAADLRMARQSGVVRVSMLPSVARLWLMPRMAALQGDPPDLTLVPITEHRLASIDARDTDLAIRFGYGDWPGVESRKLFDETLAPVASPRLAREIGSSIDALLAHPILHDSGTSSWRRWFEHVGIDFRPRAGERRFDDYDLVLGAAQAGVGVALARLPLARDAIKTGALVALPFPKIAASQSHWLVTRKQESRSAVVRLAERLIETAVRDSA
jgi:LysR family glycine cleavage system transcriptional activator